MGISSIPRGHESKRVPNLRAYLRRYLWAIAVLVTPEHEYWLLLPGIAPHFEHLLDDGQLALVILENKESPFAPSLSRSGGFETSRLNLREFCRLRPTRVLQLHFCGLAGVAHG
jgi:hypothetical protein